jgi:hypothetical protein
MGICGSKNKINILENRLDILLNNENQLITSYILLQKENQKLKKQLDIMSVALSNLENEVQCGLHNSRRLSDFIPDVIEKEEEKNIIDVVKKEPFIGEIKKKIEKQ